MVATVAIPVEQVDWVKELYPRLRPDDEAIERYRAAIDLLPPIVVARGRVLVDGYHRWQAHKREGAATVEAVDLGNLADVEIIKESLRRNSGHGVQLSTKDKKRNADVLYRGGTRDYGEIAGLLSITDKTAQEYCRDARRDELADQKQRAWDLWHDCGAESWRELGELFGIDHKTARAWVGEISNALENSPPASRQHFDVWQFTTADKGDGQQSYFGAMPPQVVENLLWLYTQPGQIVVDPFAGSGTTIDVAKRMGRRVWASDLQGNDYAPFQPIHQHDITTGWPDAAPKKADLILLDAPYWMQAKGRYSQQAEDLGNMDLPGFHAAWEATVTACADHISADGHLAFIVSPVERKDEDRVYDLAYDMYSACLNAGLQQRRRIIVTYQTQQATGQQVEWAREKRKLLKLYRDLVVLRP